MPVGPVDACVWGYPLVLFDAAARQNARSGEAALAGVTIPNDDLAVRTTWIDLTHGPTALTLGETTRYYSLTLFDGWGRSFQSLGTRTTGNHEQTYALVSPLRNGSSLNARRTIETATTRIAAVTRTAKADGDVTEPQFSIVPIGPRASVEAPACEAGVGRSSESIATQIARAGGRSFFASLRTLLNESSRYASVAPWSDVVDDALLKDSKQLDDDVATAMQLIEAELPITAPVDGWRARRAFDARGAAYLERARACRFHFLADDEQDTFHRFALLEDSGRPLHGRFTYRVHFDAWNEPPARAFWSLSVCDERFRGLPANARGWSIRSRDNLIKNSDDSIDISIQTAPPNKPNVNWLAVPERPFGLILRLYWPRPAALNGLWSPPALQAVSVAA
jgi:hypothetical protein